MKEWIHGETLGGVGSGIGRSGLGCDGCDWEIGGGDARNDMSGIFFGGE